MASDQDKEREGFEAYWNDELSQDSALPIIRKNDCIDEVDGHDWLKTVANVSWLAGRRDTVGVEDVREALTEIEKFGGYAKTLMVDSHVTADYLEGYRKRFLDFERAFGSLAAKIGGQR